MAWSEIYPGAARGHVHHGWLEARHSFSFGSWHDLQRMGFHDLRVINEDRVQPGRGFAPHSHRDMEILTLVLAGALRHQDSMGNTSVIRPGEVQYMGAGSGVQHSEMNASGTEPVHLLQIWIIPASRGGPPTYAQAPIDTTVDVLHAIAGPRAEHGVRLRQDAVVYLAHLQAGGPAVTHHFEPGRHGWLQVIRGDVQTDGLQLQAGDARVMERPPVLELRSAAGAEVLLFDLA